MKKFFCILLVSISLCTLLANSAFAYKYDKTGKKIESEENQPKEYERYVNPDLNDPDWQARKNSAAEYFSEQSALQAEEYRNESNDIDYSEAIMIERIDATRDDRSNYGYDGVWFHSPSTGFKIYLPAEWFETKLIKGDRYDSIAFTASSYDQRFRTYFRVDYTSSETITEEMDFMKEYNMGKDMELTYLDGNPVILYTATNSSFDWNTCIGFVNGNGFLYTLRIEGASFESFVEEDLISEIIYSISFES